MSHVFGKSNAKAPTAVGSLQFQTSERGGVIPLVWGTTRVAPNLLDYTDFTATAQKSGGGKGKGGGKSGTTTGYTYSASVLLGLCQGPTTGITATWLNNSKGGGLGTDSDAGAASTTTTGGDAGGFFNLFGSGSASVTSPTGGFFTVHLGNDGQAIDDYWANVHPERALHYSGTCYIAAPNMALGTSAQLPNCSAEVASVWTGYGTQGKDASPADIVFDFLTNSRYGADFPAQHLGDLTDYKNYCSAVGLALSPQIDQQQEAKQFLSDVTKITNTAVVWSDGLLKFIPYGDTAITKPDAWFISMGAGAMSSGQTPTITVSDPAIGTVVASASATAGEKFSDLVVSLVNNLLPLLPPFDMIVQGLSIDTAMGFSEKDPQYRAVITLLQQPGLGTTTVSATLPGWGAPEVVTEYGGQVSWTPDTTIQYDLTDEDFIAEATSVGSGQGLSTGAALRTGGGVIFDAMIDDPVVIQRSSPADAINNVQVEYRDRANDYNKEVAEAWDQAAIDTYGLRRETSVKADAVCDVVTAQVVAQLLLQRSTLFRNTYNFKLGWKYALLEPMDLVTISDTRLGLDRQIVRITSIEEDEEGTLSVQAEDFWAASIDCTSTAGGGGGGSSGAKFLYFEVAIDVTQSNDFGNTVGNALIGLANSTFNRNSPWGLDLNYSSIPQLAESVFWQFNFPGSLGTGVTTGWGYPSRAPGGVGEVTLVAAGDVIGFAVDMESGQIWLRNATQDPNTWFGNGVGDPSTKTGGWSFASTSIGYIPGEIFILGGACSHGTSHTQAQFTINFGGTPFVADVPDGYFPANVKTDAWDASTIPEKNVISDPADKLLLSGNTVTGGYILPASPTFENSQGPTAFLLSNHSLGIAP